MISLKIGQLSNLVKTVVACCLFTLTWSSCEKIVIDKDVPNCLERKIRKIKKEDLRNPPAKVWEWKVDGKVYYYVTSDCCDQLNYMYDDSCNEVCAPDGGFTGAGDGKCPKFRGQIERTLIWQDERK